MKNIYIGFSSTPFRMVRLVRQFTRNSYNHISISLNRESTRMYSFVRRYYKLLLYGSFVQETASRYNPEGKPRRYASASSR